MEAKTKYVYSFSSMLDPRIKNTHVKEDPAYKDIRRKFGVALKSFEKSAAAPTVVNQPVESDDSEDSDWNSQIFKKAKVCNLSAEIVKYLQEDCIPGKQDPLQYWRFKKEGFPSLGAMAKSYLSAVSTSTPSERTFSMGRLVIRHTRKSLSAEKIRALMCLNSWIRHSFLD